MDITKEELLQCIFNSFKGFNLNILDITTSPDWVKFELSGHRFKVRLDGKADTVEGNLLAGDLQSRLVTLILQQSIANLKNAKLAA